MKPAICISGLARSRNFNKNLRCLKAAFPDIPMFFSTWEETKNELSEAHGKGTNYYPEPEIHYNPWTECVIDNPHPKYRVYKDNFIKQGEFMPARGKLLNATKQLIAHAYQIADLPEEYDMIIRTRWDTVVSDKLDFTSYLEQSYNEKMAIGFAIRGDRHIRLDKFKDIDHVYIQEDTDHKWSRDWSYWINDNMIFHRRDMYDCDLVHKLHKEKRLWPAEYGWYQLLSVMDNHHCVYGGAALERFTRA